MAVSIKVFLYGGFNEGLYVDVNKNMCTSVNKGLRGGINKGLSVCVFAVEVLILQDPHVREHMAAKLVSIRDKRSLYLVGEVRANQEAEVACVWRRQIRQLWSGKEPGLTNSVRPNRRSQS